MAENLGDCICAMCRKLTKIDAEVGEITSDVSQIIAEEVSNKLDILISSVWVLQNKVDDLQESINKGGGCVNFKPKT